MQGLWQRPCSRASAQRRRLPPPAGHQVIIRAYIPWFLSLISFTANLARKGGPPNRGGCGSVPRPRNPHGWPPPACDMQTAQRMRPAAQGRASSSTATAAATLRPAHHLPPRRQPFEAPDASPGQHRRQQAVGSRLVARAADEAFSAVGSTADPIPTRLNTIPHERSTRQHFYREIVEAVMKATAAGETRIVARHAAHAAEVRCGAGHIGVAVRGCTALLPPARSALTSTAPVPACRCTIPELNTEFDVYRVGTCEWHAVSQMRSHAPMPAPPHRGQCSRCCCRWVQCWRWCVMWPPPWRLMASVSRW